MIVEVLKGELKSPFPKLMINVHGAIVLMHNALGESTLLKSFNDQPVMSGHIYMKKRNLDDYEDFYGKITLSNAD
jgi:ABC-type cobalamin/Fe3+-siderophores transport system ATPase subunit